MAHWPQSLQSLHKGLPTVGTKALIKITSNFGHKNIGSLVAQFMNQSLQIIQWDFIDHHTGAVPLVLELPQPLLDLIRSVARVGLLTDKKHIGGFTNHHVWWGAGVMDHLRQPQGLLAPFFLPGFPRNGTDKSIGKNTWSILDKLS